MCKLGLALGLGYFEMFSVYISCRTLIFRNQEIKFKWVSNISEQ